MNLFEKLKTLFSGKICSDNTKIDNGAGFVANNSPIHIYTSPPETEEDTIELSPFEKKVLISLAEGAKFAYCPDNCGTIIETTIFNTGNAKEINDNMTLDIFRAMLRKGLICDDNKHFVISDEGRRIVRKL